jgi:hypothetical protein
MVEKPRSSDTVIMCCPGVTYSLEGPNRTNTRRYVGLGISGGEVKLLLANFHCKHREKQGLKT